jgi:hypothetical protein
MPSPLFTAILFADKTFRTVTNTLKDTNGRSNFNKVRIFTRLMPRESLFPGVCEPAPCHGT